VYHMMTELFKYYTVLLKQWLVGSLKVIYSFISVASAKLFNFGLKTDICKIQLVKSSGWFAA